MSNPATSARPLLDDRLLDRLVDGELDGPQRAHLLAAIDAEPGGWRRCAMAFLEAQAWEGALRNPQSHGAVASIGMTQPPRRLRLPAPLPLTGIAAAVLVAFVTGFLARGTPGPGPSAGGTTPVSPLALAPTEPAANVAVPSPPTIPDYVRRQLERQGYEVQGGHKMVPVALGDGRQMTLPVETYKYRFVGQRLH